MRPQAVLDASAALHAVLTQEHASEVLDFLHGTALVLVPALFTSEVTNGLWKYVRSGQITRHRAIQLLDQALKLADSVVDDRDLDRKVTHSGSPMPDVRDAFIDEIRPPA